jgi:hypothetical protein
MTESDTDATLNSTDIEDHATAAIEAFTSEEPAGEPQQAEEPPAPPAEDIPPIEVQPPAEEPPVKSARPRPSPYSLQPFVRPPAHVPVSSRPHYPALSKLPPLEPLATKFDNKPYHQPKAEDTYLDRIAYFEQTGRVLDKVSADRYRKLHPLPAYEKDPAQQWAAAMYRSRKLREKRGFDRWMKQQPVQGSIHH